jgi:type VI secretion system protein ImpH
MVAAGGGTAAVVTPPAVSPPASGGAKPHAAGSCPSLDERLFAEGFAFDFFQAVRVLERLQPGRKAVGQAGPPDQEVVRFRAHLSLNFPPSAIYEIAPPAGEPSSPLMTVSFLGLTGPSGVLPRHYTEMLLRLDREARGPERYALRAWLDLFNHRLIALFYRAWEKYRFYLAYERGTFALAEPDTFTRALYSLVGLGMAPLRNRLRVGTVERVDGRPREKVLARIDDLALLHYGGILAQRPRSAVMLAALLGDYFGLAVEVGQVHGQWLQLDSGNQSQLGADNCELGVSMVAGERVWDVQSKLRLRLGPLRRAEFDAFLPDPTAVPQRKAFFLLAHLVRLYVGPDLDFDVQMVLWAADVPECQLDDSGGLGPRLGWNTWLGSEARADDAEDAVFAGEEVFRVGAA